MSVWLALLALLFSFVTDDNPIRAFIGGVGRRENSRRVSLEVDPPPAPAPPESGPFFLRVRVEAGESRKTFTVSLEQKPGELPPQEENFVYALNASSGGEAPEYFVLPSGPYPRTLAQNALAEGGERSTTRASLRREGAAGCLEVAASRNYRDEDFFSPSHFFYVARPPPRLAEAARACHGIRENSSAVDLMTVATATALNVTVVAYVAPFGGGKTDGTGEFEFKFDTHRLPVGESAIAGAGTPG